MAILSSSSESCPPGQPSGLDSSTINLIDKLDSLATFYQQQLDWVDRITQLEVKVETESEDEQPPEPDTKPRGRVPPLTSAAARRMHWRQQMRSLESKLNGRAGYKHRRQSSLRKSAGVASSRDKEYEAVGSDDILRIFGEMMGARMESCRRVQRLLSVTSKSNDHFDGRRSLKRS